MPDGLRESVYTVTLHYQDGPFWLTDGPAVFPYTFRCIGTSWGKDRWRLHLAESDRRLPEGWNTRPGQLLSALTFALEFVMNSDGGSPRSLVRITSDVIADKGP